LRGAFFALRKHFFVRAILFFDILENAKKRKRVSAPGQGTPSMPFEATRQRNIGVIIVCVVRKDDPINSTEPTKANAHNFQASARVLEFYGEFDPGSE
jgi:hypothetical protein